MHPVDQTLSRTTFLGYLDAISYSNETSYVLLFSNNDGTYYYNTNIENYEDSPYIREIYNRVMSGEEIELTNFRIAESRIRSAANRVLYPDQGNLQSEQCFHTAFALAVDRFVLPSAAFNSVCILCGQSDDASAFRNDERRKTAFKRQL